VNLKLRFYINILMEFDPKAFIDEISPQIRQIIDGKAIAR